MSNDNSGSIGHIELTTGHIELDHKIREWLTWDQNEKTRAEINDLLSNKQYDTLSKLLLSRLTFGTAGIRGRMCAGYAAMNDLVLIQTSQGLAKYLTQIDACSQSKGVVIGFDGRYNSERFAQLTANAFLSLDIRVYLFSKLVPTPFIPFAVKILGAIAGVMVTASHNPKDDNGYKVYFSNGAQITAPHDKNIQSRIIENLQPWMNAWNTNPRSNPKCSDPLDQIMEKYYQVMSFRVYDKNAIISSDLSITYTALHGVGHQYLTQAFKTCGFNHYFPVESQMIPDPEFPTVVFPNPEEGKGVLDESIKTANLTNSSIIVANDPDSDRCAVAEINSSDKQWRIFTGNEIGALLGWWQWFRHQSNPHSCPPSEVYMISSAVSSKILESMAKHEGFNWIETLTGFKWMGNKADELINNGKTVLFAFEEAIGFMVGSTVLDKDGITAAIDILELAVYLTHEKNCSLSQHLKYLYRIYGYHYNLCSYFICYDPDVIKQIFHRLSNFNGPNTYPSNVGNFQIVRIRDLNRGFDSSTPNNIPELPSSLSSFMITFYFNNGVVLTIRTSGTEPKIKYYSEAIASPQNENWVQIEQELQHLMSEMIELFLEPRKNNLIAKQD